MALINVGTTGLINRFDASKYLSPEENLPDWQVGLDQSTKNQMANQLDLASRSTDDRTNENMAGIKGYTPAAQPEPSTLAMAPMKSVEDALSRRSQRELTENLGRMRRSSMIGNEAQRAEDLARSASNYGQAQSIKIKNYEARLEYAQTLEKLRLMEEQARANILGQILGGIATVAGFALGGPAGAAAGAAVSTGGKALAAPSQRTQTEDAFASLAPKS